MCTTSHTTREICKSRGKLTTRHSRNSNRMSPQQVTRGILIHKWVDSSTGHSNRQMAKAWAVGATPALSSNRCSWWCSNCKNRATVIVARGWTSPGTLNSHLGRSFLSTTDRRVLQPNILQLPAVVWTARWSSLLLPSITTLVFSMIGRRVALLNRWILEFHSLLALSTRRKSKWDLCLFECRSHQVPSSSTNMPGGFGSIIIGTSTGSGSKDGSHLLMFGSNQVGFSQQKR